MVNTEANKASLRDALNVLNIKFDEDSLALEKVSEIEADEIDSLDIVSFIAKLEEKSGSAI